MSPERFKINRLLAFSVLLNGALCQFQFAGENRGINASAGKLGRGKASLAKISKAVLSYLWSQSFLNHQFATGANPQKQPQKKKKKKSTAHKPEEFALPVVEALEYFGLRETLTPPNFPDILEAVAAHLAGQLHHGRAYVPYRPTGNAHYHRPGERQRLESFDFGRYGPQPSVNGYAKKTTIPFGHFQGFSRNFYDNPTAFPITGFVSVNNKEQLLYNNNNNNNNDNINVFKK